MRVLSPIYADEVGRKLVDEVPRRVLEAVATEEGRRAPRLVNELTRRLPRIVDPETIAGWVDESLAWLIVRGDVEREPRGIYRCTPPYLVETGTPVNGSLLRLHGNPLAEPDLLRILKLFEPRLTHGVARPNSRSGAYEEMRPDLGLLERSLIIDPPKYSEAVRWCESRGYAVLRPSELASRLPRKDDVLSPSENDLASLGNAAFGIWETYDPTTDREERWNRAEDWQNGNAQLVRWRPSDDWEGERSTRFYYHAGSGRVAELSAQMGTLWQLYLDSLMGHPRTIWWARNRLWVPRVLPTATLRWLELLSGLRARPVGPRWRLTMDEAAAGIARSALYESLGLRFLKGYPPRQHPGRGRFGRRER